MNKKIKSLFLMPVFVASLCLSSCGGGNEDNPPAPETNFEIKTFNCYFNDLKNPGSSSLAFFDKVYELPYLNIESMTFWANLLLFDTDSGKVTFSYKDTTFTWTNIVTNATMSLDASSSTLSFSDYNAFIAKKISGTYLNTDVDKTPFLKIKEGSAIYNKEKKDTKTSFCLKDYDLGVKNYEDDYFIPFNAYLVALNIENDIVYNGKAIFKYDSDSFYANGELTEYGKAYFDTSLKFNATLAKETYNVFCLNNDMHFGTKASVLGNKKLDAFLQEKGYKAKLLNSATAKEFDDNLSYVINYLLSDNGHTIITKDGNNLFNKEQINTNVPKTDREKLMIDVYDKIKAQRDNDHTYYEDTEGRYTSIYDYDKNANAYLFAFNGFTEKAPKDDKSTIDFIKEANEFLQTNKDVKNVVIDVSLNGGGDDIAELTFESWVKGEATQYLRSCNNNIYASTTYLADINGDGKIDEKDTIKDRKVLLITSSYSYSNANVFTAMLKDAPNVTVIGDDTGGGSCNVISAVTAIGNSYRYSSASEAVYSDGTSFETGVKLPKAENKIVDFKDYVSYKEMVIKYLGA